ncbi:hypothetical protein ANN_24171 [Periplaneta americana]|uniref:Uncharacterized protein n=1 Tax=Periplaneta americana TaxID=6978 RepID=A0ABQ8S2C7_PERAM|nr:hypothetical protein ANN_24171 [Periplaneta americana]
MKEETVREKKKRKDERKTKENTKKRSGGEGGNNERKIEKYRKRYGREEGNNERKKEKIQEKIRKKREQGKENRKIRKKRYGRDEGKKERKVEKHREIWKRLSEQGKEGRKIQGDMEEKVEKYRTRCERKGNKERKIEKYRKGYGREGNKERKIENCRKRYGREEGNKERKIEKCRKRYGRDEGNKERKVEKYRTRCERKGNKERKIEKYRKGYGREGNKERKIENCRKRYGREEGNKERKIENAGRDMEEMKGTRKGRKRYGRKEGNKERKVEKYRKRYGRDEGNNETKVEKYKKRYGREEGINETKVEKYKKRYGREEGNNETKVEKYRTRCERKGNKERKIEKYRKGYGREGNKERNIQKYRKGYGREEEKKERRLEKYKSRWINRNIANASRGRRYINYWVDGIGVTKMIFGKTSYILYGCETWTLTLREEQRLRVFENKVLRKIFGANWDEVTGKWRKIHNAELHPLISSPDIIRNIKSRRLRWAGHVARIGESRNAYRVLVGRPEGKTPLGRPRRRWEDNIKMDLREVEYDDRDRINLAQDRGRWRAYVRAAMKLRFKVYHGTLYVVMWLADEPREFNLPTFQQRRITYVPEKLPDKYGVHSEEYLPRETEIRVLENKVLRKIFGAKRDEVTGEWRKLHNTELHALYSSSDIIRDIEFRRLRWAGHVACMGESRNAYRVLRGRLERKRPLGSPRRRWEDNIKVDLREVGYDDRDWINLAQDRDQWWAYVRAAMNLRIS